MIYTAISTAVYTAAALILAYVMGVA